MVVLFAKVAGKRMSLYIPLRHNREDHGTARRDLQSWANLLNFTCVRSSLLRAKKTPCVVGHVVLLRLFALRVCVCGLRVYSLLRFRLLRLVQRFATAPSPETTGRPATLARNA